jgi:hypothetical protein
MERFTGIARPIDLRFPSNRLALFATLAAGMVGLVAGANRVSAAIALGGATFLGWAIGREIDPDRTLTAAVAAPLAGLVAWVDLDRGHVPALGALYLTLVAARLIVRTTGRPPTTIDLALHVVLVGWLASTSLAWVAGLGLAVAIVLDTKLDPQAPEHQLWWGAIIGLAATLAAGLLWEPPVWQAPSVGEWIPMVVGLSGAVFLLRPEQPRSAGDHDPAPLDARRLLVGRTIVVVISIAIALMGGASGVAALSPAWVAVGVAGVIRILTQAV